MSFDWLQRTRDEAVRQDCTARRRVWQTLQRECPDFAETVPDWQRLAKRLGARISGVTAGPDGAEARWGDTDMHDE